MTNEELTEYLRIETMPASEQESLLSMLEELIAERIYAKVAEAVGGSEDEEKIASVVNPDLVRRVASSVVQEFRTAV